jgi:hypothetical protein
LLHQSKLLNFIEGRKSAKAAYLAMDELSNMMLAWYTMIIVGLDLIFWVYLGPLAQSVEQQTFNLWVVGSIPTGPTRMYNPAFSP